MEKEENVAANAGKVVSALALAAIVSTGAFAAPEAALADVAGLTPCKDSKAFAKRQKTSLKKLNSRLKLYKEGSAPALALKATIERTERRFAFYGKQGLLCGTDGLPHLIVDGDWNHAGEFVFPGIVFLYIAGWIGWVGREYLIKTKEGDKPTEKEIIIDVPLATSLVGRGFTWPVAAWSELKNGNLTVPADKITVSPR
jgi:photosystem I subunit 3